MADSDTQTNGIVRIINLRKPSRSDYLKTQSSKPQRDEDLRLEGRRLDQWISRSNSNATALHNVCTIKHKNGNIESFWKLNLNICNRLFYGIFTFSVHFAAKIL